MSTQSALCDHSEYPCEYSECALVGEPRADLLQVHDGPLVRLAAVQAVPSSASEYSRRTPAVPQRTTHWVLYSAPWGGGVPDGTPEYYGVLLSTMEHS